jgi:glutathione S-transferase
MITIHCLDNSRAIRLVWLMEDIGAPYDLKRYNRTAEFGAPEALKAVHPLGKSPVIEDGSLCIAESATCLRYLVEKFGASHYGPKLGTPEYYHHEELLDYVESSFAQACMGVLLPTLSDQDVPEDARAALKLHLDYLGQNLPESGLLFGDEVTLADIQFSYLLANLSATGFLQDAPRIGAYWDTLQHQSGYRKSIEKAGPMAPDT